MSTVKRILASVAVTALACVGMTSAYADNAPAYDPGAACKKPEYPRASLVNEEAGTVTIAFNVAADGKVTDSKIVKSSGFKNLDKAAQKDLGACKFKAGVKDGKPVDGVATVDWVWKLD